MWFKYHWASETTADVLQLCSSAVTVLTFSFLSCSPTTWTHADLHVEQKLIVSLQSDSVKTPTDQPHYILYLQQRILVWYKAVYHQSALYSSTYSGFCLWWSMFEGILLWTRPDGVGWLRAAERDEVQLSAVFVWTVMDLMYEDNRTIHQPPVSRKTSQRSPELLYIPRNRFMNMETN